MKAYFEYISENESSFIDFRSYCRLIILFLLFLLIVYFFLSKRNIHEYSYDKGVVEYIGPSSVRVESRNNYDFRKTIKKETIKLRLNGDAYHVLYQLYKHENNVLEKIQKGDTIEIYYKKIENHLELYEIFKNKKSILNHKGRQNEGVILITILIVVLLITLFILFYTTKLRKKYLKNKGVFID